MSIDKLVASIHKKFGDGALQFGTGTHVKVDAIPTGLLNLDYALGCGGLPIGRIIEIFGAESSGKTTMALTAIANCQAATLSYLGAGSRNGVAAFIDAEHAIDFEWAKKLGVDISKLLFTQPDSGEQAFDIIDQMVESGEVDLIVVDSVAALIPKEELEGEVDDIQIGAQARMISKNLRRIVSKLTKSKCTMIFINQLRDKIGGFSRPGGPPPEVTPGGRALKFYASIRMSIKRKEQITASQVAIGAHVGIKILKNKVAPPFRTAELELYFSGDQVGFSRKASIFEAATASGVLTVRGSNYYFGADKVGAGSDKTKEALVNDQSLSDRVRQAVLSTIVQRTAVVEDIKTIEESDDATDI